MSSCLRSSQSTEKDGPLHERGLRRILVQSIKDANPHFTSPEQDAARTVWSMLEESIHLTGSDGGISEENLCTAMRNLADYGGHLSMQITAQNAGLLMTYKGAAIICEAFELAPPNGEVMGFNGRLRRCFPSHAVSISLKKFREPTFQSMLAKTIATMSVQAVEEMVPKARKAGQYHVETRDTTSPRIVIELLVTILAAVGECVTMPLIWKNTREEVLWSDALLSWLRSPAWSLDRVAMQTILSRSATPWLYKDIMIIFMSHVADLAASNNMATDLLHCLLSKVTLRMRKLSRVSTPSWQTGVERSLSRTYMVMQSRWDISQTHLQPEIDLSALVHLDFARDTCIILPKLDELLRDMTKGSTGVMTPKFQPRILKVEAPSGILPCPAVNGGDQHSLDLAIFEQWIDKHLGQYLDMHLAEPDFCQRLMAVAKDYHVKASGHYNRNPD
ncbi:hypothetical protein ANO11243_066740 [Dothideomycetidae sp. 11243]|nr:hypothetical protein ANO11243_066740 [fungal sp. No.11243]